MYLLVSSSTPVADPSFHSTASREYRSHLHTSAILLAETATGACLEPRRQCYHQDGLMCDDSEFFVDVCPRNVRRELQRSVRY
jgi:hypothetical protein